jgi:hypothetical protein
MAGTAPAAWRVVLFAAAVPLLLRFVRIDRLGGWLEPRREPPRSPAGPAIDGMVRRIDRLRLAGRPLVRSGCLTRAITLYYFLRRAGAPATLHFGMGELRDGFAGHCWVELAGEPIAEPRDPRPLYPEMLRFPQSSAR